MNHPDVIIVGGGIIGCALAEELARRGQRVLVLERGRIGQEASAAAAGILSAQMDLTRPGPLFELCRLSRRLYPRWVEHLQRRSRTDLAYHVDGILYLAMTGREERAKARQAHWQRARGLRVERWSRREVLRREPAVDGRFKSAFHFPTEAQVDNIAVMRALVSACRHAKVDLREGVEVRRVLIRRRAVRGVETADGPLNAAVVVNCLGSWAAMGGRFPVELPVVPARGQMLAFAASPRLFRHVVMSERAYVVQRRDGRLLVGSTIEHVGFDKALTLEGIHRILSGLRSMSSAITSSTFLEAWAGFRPATPDALPILGPTPIEGLYIASGHFRHGILLAPITAKVLAEVILTGRSSLDLAPFLATRFIR